MMVLHGNNMSVSSGIPLYSGAVQQFVFVIVLEEEEEDTLSSWACRSICTAHDSRMNREALQIDKI